MRSRIANLGGKVKNFNLVAVALFRQEKLSVTGKVFLAGSHSPVHLAPGVPPRVDPLLLALKLSISFLCVLGVLCGSLKNNISQIK
ncbi:hypothetical protein [Coleofasciculus sp. H7-2]|uniref:hypothetical protein n=1 Tax=Coleofasciculus sp. H7-2 TaxID=3351545 RepID=UPI003670CED8